jgi:hypothetical protein
VVELVKRRKLMREIDDFVKWNNTDEHYDFEVYIEKEIVPDFKKKPEILIDIAVGKVKDGEISILFIKKENVYG